MLFLYYKSGVDIDQGVADMLDAVTRLGGDAGVIAITHDLEISMSYNSDGMKRGSVSTQQPVYVATFA